MTYCVEVKANDRTCACKGGKKSKCPNDDKQIAKGTRATSPFQTFSNLPSEVVRSPRPAFPIVCRRHPLRRHARDRGRPQADGLEGTFSTPISPRYARGAYLCAPARRASTRFKIASVFPL